VAKNPKHKNKSDYMYPLPAKRPLSFKRDYGEYGAVAFVAPGLDSI
jgi:hypothetical protein